MTNHEKLFKGEEFKLNDHITIKHPTVGEVMEYGEQKYFSLVRAFTVTPSDMKSALFDNGFDWEEVEEIESFAYTIRGFRPVDTSILFGENINFSDFIICINNQNQEKALVEVENNKPKNNGCIIDSYTQMKISDYLRDMHSWTKNTERAGNEGTKQILIDDERESIMMAQRKPFQSALLPMLFAGVNSADFKYDYESVKNLPIFLFLGSIKQIGAQKEIQYIKQGIYSGCIDVKKSGISDSKLAWIQDLK